MRESVDRALMIDDGGDSSRLAMLSAICIDADVVEDARLRVEALRSEMETLIPSLRHEDEFHGIRLGRRLQKTERRRARRENRIPMKDHERAFIFQHALHHLGHLPGHVRVYSVALKTRGRQAGEPRGRDVRRVTAGLMNWIARHESKVTYAAMDKGRQFRHNRDGFASAAKANAGAILASLKPVDSKDDVLVQMADLVAYSAFQAQRLEDPGRQRFPDMHRWYEDALSDLLAPGSGTGGVLHLSP